MIEMRLIGTPAEVDSALTALVEAGIGVQATHRTPRPGGYVCQDGRLTPPRPVNDRAHGIGDLARALGGSEDSFTGTLLLLAAKAQATPERYLPLRAAFPREVIAWELWMASPAPDPDELQLLVQSAESFAQALTMRRAARDAGVQFGQGVTD